MTFVAPRHWKTALGVPAAKDGALAAPTSGSASLASVNHDGRAEAALIGLSQLHCIAEAA
jgi:hypothetical protein